ncbi:MAG TPA: hypothetical protein DGG94_04950, partial [Micromonosporaceae bacterium]|nr:hypothetical protein [Micromonosporaceae bacterium]
ALLAEVGLPWLGRLLHRPTLIDLARQHDPAISEPIKEVAPPVLLGDEGLSTELDDSAGNSDDQAWLWWQLNRLDARQRQICRTPLSQSIAYVMVGPRPKDRRRPLITAEHPSQVITADDPATGERLAGLKTWYDRLTRVWRACCVHAGAATRFISDAPSTSDTDSRRVAGIGSWKQIEQRPNPLGLVPIVPFPCRPDLGEEREAEFAGFLDTQDRINLGVLNRMTAGRYGAFRQKYVTGHKFKRRTDPETGLEIVESPFRPDPGALWASERENTKFEKFSQTELLGYLKSSEADIRTLFVLTATPAYYLPGDLINIGTDTVTALDTNYVAKVGEHQAFYGRRGRKPLPSLPKSPVPSGTSPLPRSAGRTRVSSTPA